MNITSLKAVLISIVLSSSLSVFAEDKVVTENDLKSTQIEKELNFLFTKALSTAATKLDAERQMTPFAMILKQNGGIGFFEIEGVKAKELSVNQQVFQIRRYLTELALNSEIKASVLGLYINMSDGKNSKQGISFEVEHLEGVALLRVIPVTEKQNGDQPSTIVIHTESITTSVKHAMVFTDMAKSISKNN